MNRKTQFVLVASTLLAFASPMVHAQSAAGAVVAASAPGQALIARSIRVTAIVVEIDAATRSVSLKGPQGRVIDVVAGPDVKNFAQLKVGDRVQAEYMQALTLQLRKGGNGIRESSVKQGAAAAPAGARPAAAAGRQVTVLADVTAVDRKKSVVTLRGPKGNSVDLAVADPAQLKLVKTGDQVEATYTEAAAMSIEPSPKVGPK
jgi:Cu/Ag efflux protein CusF